MTNGLESVITKSASAVPPSMVALVAFDKVRVAVSVSSSPAVATVSVVMGIEIVPLVSPADMVKVPVVPV